MNAVVVEGDQATAGNCIANVELQPIRVGRAGRARHALSVLDGSAQSWLVRLDEQAARFRRLEAARAEILGELLNENTIREIANPLVIN